MSTGAELVKEFRASDREHWRRQLFKMLAERREIQRKQMADMFYRAELALERAQEQPRHDR
jgi:hypothetical protein